MVEPNRHALDPRTRQPNAFHRAAAPRSGRRRRSPQGLTQMMTDDTVQLLVSTRANLKSTATQEQDQGAELHPHRIDSSSITCRTVLIHRMDGYNMRRLEVQGAATTVINLRGSRFFTSRRNLAAAANQARRGRRGSWAVAVGSGPGRGCVWPGLCVWPARSIVDGTHCMAPAAFTVFC